MALPLQYHGAEGVDTGGNHERPIQ
jgi:hypothetical protein